MFTQRNKVHLAGLLAFGVSMLLGQSAYAIGTASGTSVANGVTVDYQVTGVSQTQLTSSVSFVVDNKIMLALGITNDTVIPGQTDQVLTYVITNNGNTAQSYALTVANSTVADNFDMNNVRVYVETNGTAGWQAGDTLYTSGSGNKATGAANVAANGTLTVYVVADTPATAVNAQTARYDLLATTLNATGGAINTAGVVTLDSSAAAWNAATVQVVYAEGAVGPHVADTLNDGEQSATATYTVTSAALTVTKTQAVTNDNVGAVVPGFEKAIPGAIVTYTITINNTAGGVSATTMVVNDDFPEATLTFVNGSADVTVGALVDTNIANGATGVNTGATVTVSSQGGTAENDRIAVSGFSVPAGQTAIITFDVTID